MRTYIFILALFFLCNCQKSSQQRDFFVEMNNQTLYISNLGEVKNLGKIDYSESPTTFNNKSYFLLNSDLWFRGYFRSEQKKIFYLPTKLVSANEDYSTVKEKLFFDFDKNIGDSIIITPFDDLPTHILLIQGKYYNASIHDTVFVCSHKEIQLNKQQLNTAIDRAYITTMYISQRKGVLGFIFYFPYLDDKFKSFYILQNHD